MKLLVLFSLAAGAFALGGCPINQHYESCGTACPLTCDNYKNPSRVCVMMCVPGCHCDAGYVKDDDGMCVLPENCPNRAPETCGENEHYNACGTDCPVTCDNYENPPVVCNFMCRIGCECDKGFVRSPDGRCLLPEDCPLRTSEKNCEDELDTGVCFGYFPMYHYDKEEGICKKFIYGGCGGNGNRYKTEAECLQNCGKSRSESACDQERKTGPCMAAFRRYFFNKESGNCELFIYGGCQGNDNNFETKEDCINTCIP
ncbi:hypothetical protein CDAR_451911 [Caerostris darwini]|uniref:BPTI/Kunitz inhibitor domain-containing protein n=1 Tax=Caerostris darwini TaxID=1538125 RepID=A0AAV4X7P5_9ARAC|nr:hypothetical protein CDAR_451911 [Caerostris darwini]